MKCFWGNFSYILSYMTFHKKGSQKFTTSQERQSKKRHRNHSGCGGALLLGEFGIRYVASADHSLQRQTHTELETDCEGRELIGIV